MERLEVTPSHLREAARALTGAANGIADDLEALESAADELRLSWEGDAHDAFDTRQTRLRLRMAQHKEQLVKIAEQVSALADDYGEIDRAAARALGGQE